MHHLVEGAVHEQPYGLFHMFLPKVDRTEDQMVLEPKGHGVERETRPQRKTVIDAEIMLSNDDKISCFKILDPKGREIPFTVYAISHKGHSTISPVNLPGDLSVTRYNIRFILPIDSIGFNTLTVRPCQGLLKIDINENAKADLLENRFVRCKINTNGTITVTNKITGKIYDNLLIMEDCEEIGDEYVHRESENSKKFTSDFVTSNISVIEDNLLRIRDLATQAANGIYSEESMQAMQNEVDARIEEINRIANASNFNGLNLLNGNEAFKNGLRLQVGANSEKETNCVVVPAEIFANAEASSLGLIAKNGAQFQTTEEVFKSASNAALFIADVDKALTSMNTHKATIGAIQNRLESANDSLTTMIENATAAKSTIMDADIAEESANYTRATILQQTASTLLVQANSLPQIALTLLQ